MNCNIQKKKGKILGQFTLNAYSDEPALPDISPDDAGKALVVDENGDIVLETISTDVKLYGHKIRIKTSGTYGYSYIGIIYTFTNTEFTPATLASWLNSKGFNALSEMYPAMKNPVLTFNSSNKTGLHWIPGIYSENGSTLKFRESTLSFSITDNTVTLNENTSAASYSTVDTFTDVVFEL